jgi:dTDP-L-rhamnose 4-epimerase
VPEAAFQVFNIGSGEDRTVREVANKMAHAVGKPHIEPSITGKYRMGDVRHCFPDISHARRVLGFEPRQGFAAGLEELAEWLRGQVAIDRAAEAKAELEARGLAL